MKYLGILAALLLSGCAAPAPPDTRAAEEEELRKAEVEWVKAAQAKQVEAWMAFYAPEAAVLPPNEKLAATPEAIRPIIAGLLGLPDLSISWKLTRLEVSRSGDLAYGYGPYEISFTDKGKKISDTGKVLEIWKKQADGGWRCIVDTWNSDLPAAPPAK